MDTTKPKTTPKDFFLWAGAMLAFYWSVIAFVFLTFDYINYAFPNALAYYPSNPYDSGISTEMASIIVLLPLCLLLMRFITKEAVRDPSRNEIWVRRWALIFTLFVAGVAMAADLITLLTSFLSGEALTTAFLLKVLVVLLVAGGVFLHFIAELKGYWLEFPARKGYVRIAVGLLAAGTIVAGFFIVGTPQQARLGRFDEGKVNALQGLDNQIKYYWQAKHVLPQSLEIMNKELPNDSALSIDAQTGEPYVYEVTGERSFKLCATFNRESSSGSAANTRAVMPTYKGESVADTWQHGVGQQCFVRVIDPAFYPPIK